MTELMTAGSKCIKEKVSNYFYDFISIWNEWLIIDQLKVGLGFKLENVQKIWSKMHSDGYRKWKQPDKSKRNQTRPS